MDKTYTTVQGDTWDLIAFKKLGNEKRMDKLIEANPDYRDTFLFSAGINLIIPQIDIDSLSKDPKPPWQK